MIFYVNFKMNVEGCSSGLHLLSTGGGAGFHMGGNAGRFFLRCAALPLRRGRMAGSCHNRRSIK